MAPPTTSTPTDLLPSKITSVKDLVAAESNGLASIPSAFHSRAGLLEDEVVDDSLAAFIPVIDFSQLTSPDPQVHAHALQQLYRASTEWSVFMLINHGISESLMQEVVNKSLEFHNLPLEERKKFSDQGLFSPIRYGTSSHSQSDANQYWRDYLRVTAFPEFHCPQKPPGFREAAFEYTGQIRGITKVLLQGLSESLGLEPNAILDYSGFEHSGFQKFQVNLYPPCPRPDLALGLPSHTDSGFFTFIIQNGIGGLQVKRDGKWVNVNPLPNSLPVILSDQIESVSNGRFKSVWHRAMLNSSLTRVTITVVNAPPLDEEFGPVPELVKKEKPLFKSITQRDYTLLQQKARTVGARALEELRI